MGAVCSRPRRQQCPTLTVGIPLLVPTRPARREVSDMAVVSVSTEHPRTYSLSSCGYARNLGEPASYGKTFPESLNVADSSLGSANRGLDRDGS